MIRAYIRVSNCILKSSSYVMHSGDDDDEMNPNEK